MTGDETMAPNGKLQSGRHVIDRGPAERLVGWAAIAAAASAVLAWAACCVLPLVLSLGGLGFGMTGWIVGQRNGLTLAALAAVGVGWGLTWRRARTCRVDGTCPPPSRLTVGGLAGASVLTLAARIWQPLIEPWLLSLLRVLRG